MERCNHKERQCFRGGQGKPYSVNPREARNDKKTWDKEDHTSAKREQCGRERPLDTLEVADCRDVHDREGEAYGHEGNAVGRK